MLIKECFNILDTLLHLLSELPVSASQFSSADRSTSRGTVQKFQARA
jgi:hypothetical protein